MTFEVAKIPSESPAAQRPNGRPSKGSLADAQRQLNDNQLRFAVWMSIPEKDRRPTSKEALADQLGVSVMTLWRWSKKPEVVMATRWLTLQGAGDPVRVSNVIDFLYQTTMNVDARLETRLTAARDWLKAVGVHEAWKYDNKLITPDEVKELDLDALSDEEIWELYEQRARDAGLPANTAADFLAQKSRDSEVVEAEVVE